MKRTNKIVSAFLNLLKVASYVSLCACSGNQVKDKCIQAAGDILPEVKEQENVQNKEVSDKSNEAEKNHDKLTNLLVAYQSVKKENNKDKETFSSTKNAQAKTNKKAKGSNGKSSSRHKRNKSSISVSSISDLTTTPILGDLSIVFDAAGKLKINNCSYSVANENEFKIFLEYLEKAKTEKKSIKGLDSIFPKAEKERKVNKDSVRLWKKNWFWKSINAHWDLFKELNLQKFSIKPKNEEENIYIEGLGVTDFLFSDIVNKKKVESLDGKKEKTTTKTKTVAEIKDEYNKVFQIKADHTPRGK